MVKFFIRDFKETDLYGVTDLYIEAFSKGPWSEFKKCKQCGINYGENEVRKTEYYTGYRGETDDYLVTVNEKGEVLSNCKKCGADMKPGGQGGCKPIYLTSENLVDFWSRKDVKEDIDFCQSQKNPKILIAETQTKTFGTRYFPGIEERFLLQGKMVGFCWGYKLPFEKFPFLKDKVDKNSGYGDELVVTSELEELASVKDCYKN